MYIKRITREIRLWTWLTFLHKKVIGRRGKALKGTTRAHIHCKALKASKKYTMKLASKCKACKNATAAYTVVAGNTWEYIQLYPNNLTNEIFSPGTMFL